MDPRRFLIPAAGWLLLSSCTGLGLGPLETAEPAETARPIVSTPPAGLSEAASLAVRKAPAVAPPVVPTPEPADRPTPPGLAAVETTDRPDETVGSGDRSADRTASAPVETDEYIGAVKVFAWAPGRVFEVRAAPLRVTTLSLAPGERLLSKAAGDTVRWQIGELTSGPEDGRQTHVVLKPLQRGLDTNLILTTNKRAYLIDLKSGPVEGFNPAVAWSFGLEDLVSSSPASETDGPTAEPAPFRGEPVVLPQGEPEGRYRIEPQGRKARWTPTAVFNDGRRTFITFDPDLQVDEAPALFLIAPDGERQLVNYRQVGGLFVVDRVFDRAELRLGGRRPQVVVLRRLPGAPT
jgi:type IV secretion system protein TrbG